MTDTSKHYDFKSIEAHWQSRWLKEKPYRADENPDKEKYYSLDMFPYPSGAGLHIGHPEGYTASDVMTRYQWGQGKSVLHPMGWDAFGLPAEQYALKTGTPPSETTQANIDQIRKQIQSLGFAIDWDREVNTTDPHYYRWTQWIFLKLFQHGLAYVDERAVWWCPALNAVLANEEVINGRSERGNHPVVRRKLKQWILRITDYAETLLEGLEDLEWPDSTKRQQIAWIGRSEGAHVQFSIENHDAKVGVFTTRVDTLMGATYLVLAPEHPLVESLMTPDQAQSVVAYREEAARKSDLERTELNKDKTGVFSGRYAIHPLTQEKLPIWIADYVLATYATGAVMAVPAHDERDWAFAQKYGLAIRKVIDTDEAEELPILKEGVLVDSGVFTGLGSAQAKQKITASLQKEGKAEAQVTYKLRDWIFSRQRYWGEPIPIVWISQSDYARLGATEESPLKPTLPKDAVCYEKDGKTHCAVPTLVENLPLELPHLEDYAPGDSGESPLSRAQDWLEVCLNIETGEIRPRKDQEPGGAWVAGRRETNTMPQWAGSCWYHLRYMDPQNAHALVDPKKEAYWKTPDLYIGGAEHAVLHLLYARFWHRFLYDIGVLSQKEPYKRLFHQGIILGQDGEKMSKSRGNVVNPDDVVDRYGADSLRLFELFLGPLEMVKPWNEQGIEGVYRFLKKLWRSLIDEKTGSVYAHRLSQDTEDSELERLLHQTIAKVTEDIIHLRFNTAISQMMIFVNGFSKSERSTEASLLAFLRILEPFAPHISQEIYSRVKPEGGFLVHQAWPTWDNAILQEQQVTLAVQINGKLRGELSVSPDESQESVQEKAFQLPRVKAHAHPSEVRTYIYVPGKILNIVLGKRPE